MKSLFLGVLVVLLVGIGGFVYRNAVEHRAQPVGCTMEAKVCPDGTAVGRTGPACEFSECLPPNITFEKVNISFALPTGYVEREVRNNETDIAAYEVRAGDDSLPSAEIHFKQYEIPSGMSALTVIQQTAIGGASGEPVPTIAYSSTVIGPHRFTVVSIERFEAVIHTAYYLARSTDVLRFDAIDRDVLNWMSQDIDLSKLPAATALRALLATLQTGV